MWHRARRTSYVCLLVFWSLVYPNQCTALFARDCSEPSDSQLCGILLDQEGLSLENGRAEVDTETLEAVTLVSTLPGPVQEVQGQLSSAQSALLAALSSIVLSRLQFSLHPTPAEMGQTPRRAYILCCGDIAMSVGRIKIHTERF